jgi:hypothetical protein
MQQGSTVGGDVYVGASQALLTDVAGSVMGGGNSLRVDGTIGGDVVAGISDGSFAMTPGMLQSDSQMPVVSQIPQGLSFGAKAKVEGDLSYNSNSAVTVPQGVVGGSVSRSIESTVTDSTETQQADAQKELPPIARYLGYVLGSFIMLMVVGVVLNRIAPNFLTGTVETVRLRALASFGAGLLGYIVAYLLIPAAVGLAIVLIILPLAGTDERLIGFLTLLGLGTFTAFSFITNWIAPIVIALLLGGWIVRRFKRESAPNIFLALAVGLAILTLLLAIPLFGRFLIGSVIGAIGLGAILIYAWPRRRPTSDPHDPNRTPPPDRTVSMERTGV